MNKYNYIIGVILLMICGSFCKGADSTQINQKDENKTDIFSESSIYKPLKASWSNMSYLMSYCAENGLDLVNCRYEHIKKRFIDFNSFNKKLFVDAINKSNVEVYNNFSMDNDTILFIVNPSFGVLIWNKRCQVNIFKFVQNNDYNNPQIGWMAKKTTNILAQYPELKVKIENWDFPFLSSVKRSPKLKGNEMPSFVFRVIIQTGHIIGCEWIKLETLFKPDAVLIID